MLKRLGEEKEELNLRWTRMHMGSHFSVVINFSSAAHRLKAFILLNVEMEFESLLREYVLNILLHHLNPHCKSPLALCPGFKKKIVLCFLEAFFLFEYGGFAQ